MKITTDFRTMKKTLIHVVRSNVPKFLATNASTDEAHLTGFWSARNNNGNFLRIKLRVPINGILRS
jgi:hypothetical protein